MRLNRLCLVVLIGCHGPPPPAVEGAAALDWSDAPLGLSAESALARIPEGRQYELGWPTGPGALHGVFSGLGGLELSWRANRRQAPAVQEAVDPITCPEPPCLLVPIRVEHRYDDGLRGWGYGVISAPDGNPDRWRLVPYPAIVQAHGPLKSATQETWSDAFWLTLTSQLDPLPVVPPKPVSADRVEAPAEDAPRAWIFVNATYANGASQEAVGATLAAVTP